MCEQLYDVLNRKHFIEGGVLNSTALLLDSAVEVGVDRGACEAFLDTDVGVSEILSAVDIVQQLGIHSIPTLIVDGKYFVNGAQTSQYIKEILRAVVKEKRCASADKGSDGCNIFQDILTLKK